MNKEQKTEQKAKLERIKIQSEELATKLAKQAKEERLELGKARLEISRAIVERFLQLEKEIGDEFDRPSDLEEDAREYYAQFLRSQIDTHAKYWLPFVNRFIRALFAPLP